MEKTPMTNPYSPDNKNNRKNIEARPNKTMNSTEHSHSSADNSGN